MREAIARQESANGSTIWDELAKMVYTGRPAYKLRALTLIQQSLLGTVKVSQTTINEKSEHHEHHHGPVILPTLYEQDKPREMVDDPNFVPVPRDKS